jgi:hypothetical protein
MGVLWARRRWQRATHRTVRGVPRIVWCVARPIQIGDVRLPLRDRARERATDIKALSVASGYLLGNTTGGRPHKWAKSL